MIMTAKVSPKKLHFDFEDIKKRRETVNYSESEYYLQEKIKSPKTQKKEGLFVHDRKSSKILDRNHSKIPFYEPKKIYRISSQSSNHNEVTPKKLNLYQIDSNSRYKIVRKSHSISLVDTPKKLNLKRKTEEALNSLRRNQNNNAHQVEQIHSSKQLKTSSNSVNANLKSHSKTNIRAMGPNMQNKFPLKIEKNSRNQNQTGKKSSSQIASHSSSQIQEEFSTSKKVKSKQLIEDQMSTNRKGTGLSSNKRKVKQHIEEKCHNYDTYFGGEGSTKKIINQDTAKKTSKKQIEPSLSSKNIKVIKQSSTSRTLKRRISTQQTPVSPQEPFNSSHNQNDSKVLFAENSCLQYGLMSHSGQFDNGKQGHQDLQSKEYQTIFLRCKNLIKTYQQKFEEIRIENDLLKEQNQYLKNKMNSARDVRGSN